jgi:hypothetical protein
MQQQEQQATKSKLQLQEIQTAFKPELNACVDRGI